MGMVLPVVGMIIYNWAVELEKQSINKALPLSKNSEEDQTFEGRDGEFSCEGC